MKTFTLAVLAAGAALLAQAETAVSTNTYALVELNSSATNTIICVPWKGYTSDGKPTKDLAVDRLVLPRNLTTGDLLIKLDGSDYLAWSLEEVEGSATGERAWQPITTVDATVVDSVTKSQLKTNDGTGTATCGLGVWLIRKDPTKPFYLHGQWTSTYDKVTVAKGSADAYAFTMLANPNREATEINKLDWSGVDPNDVIVINTDKLTSRDCTWNATKGQWYYSTKEVAKVVGKITTYKTVSHYDLVVPAGVGFWYRSAGGEPTVDWSDLKSE